MTTNHTVLPPLVREARFRAEAMRIIHMTYHQSIDMVVSLLKEAGYEPDPTTEDGWTKS